MTPRPNIKTLKQQHLALAPLNWRSSPLAIYYGEGLHSSKERDDMSTPRPIRADAARNRDAIVAAARVAFDRGELDRRFDDFASLAGVGTGTLYRHFPTRELLPRRSTVRKSRRCVSTPDSSSSTGPRSRPSRRSCTTSSTGPRPAQGWRARLLTSCDSSQRHRHTVRAPSRRPWTIWSPQQRATVASDLKLRRRRHDGTARYRLLVRPPRLASRRQGAD